MPCFELLLILQRYPLVLGPHLLHDPGQVLSLGSINVHVDANLGNLVSQLYNILLRRK